MTYLKSKKIKEKKCRVCRKMFMPFKSTDMVCSVKCGAIYRKEHLKVNTPIKKRSDKGIKADREYTKLRKEFLSLPENKFCFVDGCNRLANTVEHLAGRIGDNYLDTSTWMPCCIQHNLEFESNPELSQKYQLSRFHEGKKIKKD